MKVPSAISHDQLRQALQALGLPMETSALEISAGPAPIVRAEVTDASNGRITVFRIPVITLFDATPPEAKPIEIRPIDV